ncbi:ASCH domain-containing protein [Piscinibacter sakaiensis]|uniref:ASCH domain-containing protein n=1 Tax=Piscinibacter sakaiensis TaxID=1547922 RepID=UPI003AADC965
MSRPPAAGQVPAIEAFWNAYQAAGGERVEGFSATALGPTAVVADELAELVERGVKRAHASLLRDFQQSLEALPQPGDHLVVLDGGGLPRAIVRTSHVEKRHFADIDAQFAFDCGEGDLSLGWWLTAYRQQFAEQAEREGFEVGERLELVLEFFDLVWPPAASSQPPTAGE